MATRDVVIAIIGKDLASPAFAKAGASAEATAKSVNASSRAMAGMTGAAAKMAVGLGAAYGVIASVKLATAFEKQMTLIQTQAGASADEVKRLSSAVLDMAGQVGTAPDQLATSLYHIESVGLRGGKALDVLKIAAEGAKIGNASLEETTNALTATVASGIPGVKNMSQAMGALNTIVGAGDMKLSDLNEAMGSGILVVAKQFGLSLTDVGAALATFGDNNIRGAEAATMLRVSITSMAHPVAGGVKMLDQMGMKANQLATDMKTGGLMSALVDLKSHLKAAGDTGAAVGPVLTDIFGKKAGPGISVLVDQLSRFQTKTTDITKGAETFSAAWIATTKTAAYAFSSLRASAEAMAIKIYQNVTPVLGKLATNINSVLPAAIHIAQGALTPFALAWHMLSDALSGVGSLLKSMSGLLSSIGPIIKVVGTGLATMWLAFKAGEFAILTIKAIGDVMGAMTLKAVNASIAVQNFGTRFTASAVTSGAAAGTMAAEAEAASASIVASGEAASIGWKSVLGPIALAAGVVFGLVTMFHKSSSASKEATAAAKAYSDILTAGGGQGDLFGGIAKQLTDNNVPEKINDLNKALGGGQFYAIDFAHAIENGGPALKDLQTRLQGVIAAGTQTSVSMSKAGGSVNAVVSPAALKATKLLSDLNTQYDTLTKTVQKDLTDTKAFAGVSSSIDKVAASTTVAAGTATTYAQMMGIAVDKNGVAAVSSATLTKAVDTVASAYNNATQSGDGFLTALNAFSSSAGTAADRAALIGATLKAANGDALNFVSAMNTGATADRTFASDIEAAAKAIGKNGESTKTYLKSIINLRTGTIDYTKTAAGPLISDLQSMQTAAMNAAEAMYQHAKQTMSSKDAADAAYKVYVSQTRGSLIAEAKQLGLTKDQAKKLADQYFGMPSKVKTLIEQEGANPVVTVLNKIGAQLAFLTGHPWNPKVNAATAAATAKLKAMQTLLTTIANGKYEAQVTATGSVNVSGAGSKGSQYSGHYAAGGSVRDGFFTVGEQGYELGYKHGNNVQIYSHSQSQKMTGMASVPGYARGTSGHRVWVYAGKDYASAAAAHNAEVSAQNAANKKHASYITAINGTDTRGLYKSVVNGSPSEISSAVVKLMGDSSAAGGSKSLAKSLAKDNTALEMMASRRLVIAAKLATANQNLATAQSNYNNEKSSTASVTTGLFNASTSGLDPFGQTSAGSIVAALQKTVAAAKAFAKNLVTLKRNGVPNVIIAQLAQAGPVAGAAAATALLSASKSQINALKSGESALSSTANSIGGISADSLYGAGVNAAKGIVAGLKSQQKTVQKAMTDMAKTMVNQIKHDLGIHSPSRVFHQLGGHIGKGLANGVKSTYPTVQDAISGMYDRAEFPTRSGMGGGNSYVFNNYEQTDPVATSAATLRRIVHAGI